MSSDYSIHELCADFEVSRSGYHDWAGRLPSARAQANALLLELIVQAPAKLLARACH